MLHFKEYKIDEQIRQIVFVNLQKLWKAFHFQKDIETVIMTL